MRASRPTSTSSIDPLCGAALRVEALPLVGGCSLALTTPQRRVPGRRVDERPQSETVLEVGRIAKAHGIRGEVLVALTGDRTERVAEGAVLQTAGGRDLVVRRATSHQGKWIVTFEGVTTRTEAEALHGQLLFGEPIDDPDTLFVHELIGATVVHSASGEEIGTVESVEANPASDLLVLAGSGALIPVRFVVDRDADGRLRVDIPEGLLDL